MAQVFHSSCVFACRTSFKRPPHAQETPCACCGEATVDLGSKFKPPKKTDLSQWKKVRLMCEGGY